MEKVKLTKEQKKEIIRLQNRYGESIITFNEYCEQLIALVGQDCVNEFVYINCWGRKEMGIEIAKYKRHLTPEQLLEQKAYHRSLLLQDTPYD